MALDPPATAKPMKLKRAPSYATSSGTSGVRPLSPGSSDEEEKMRTSNAKRPRTRARTQSNGSTASGSTCVEKDKVILMSTSLDKRQESAKGARTAKAKRVKTPEPILELGPPLSVQPEDASTFKSSTLASSVEVKKEKQVPIISQATSPRLRPRARTSVTLNKAPLPAANDNSNIDATHIKLAETLAAAAAMALTPADGTRSKSRSRSISPVQPSHPMVPASPPRTLRRTTKTVFSKFQGQGRVLFGDDSPFPHPSGSNSNASASVSGNGITFATAPASSSGDRPCLGEAFILSTTTSTSKEVVRKERERPTG
jgi:hypothetical protein